MYKTCTCSYASTQNLLKFWIIYPQRDQRTVAPCRELGSLPHITDHKLSEYFVYCDCDFYQLSPHTFAQHISQWTKRLENQICGYL